MEAVMVCMQYVLRFYSGGCTALLGRVMGLINHKLPGGYTLILTGRVPRRIAHLGGDFGLVVGALQPRRLEWTRRRSSSRLDLEIIVSLAKRPWFIKEGK